MIHNRDADADLMAALGDYDNTVILHCFSSPLEVAEQALERGYVLSFAGNVTFKRNEHLRAAVAKAPAAQLLVETDAPYMTASPSGVPAMSRRLLDTKFVRWLPRVIFLPRRWRSSSRIMLRECTASPSLRLTHQ